MANPNPKVPVHAQFQPGRSGNPQGGRKTARSSAPQPPPVDLTQAQRRAVVRAIQSSRLEDVRKILGEAVAPHLGDVLRGVIAEAAAGSAAGAQAILGLVTPRQATERIDLQLDPAASPAARARAVVDAATAGRISVDAASKLTNMIGTEQQLAESAVWREWLRLVKTGTLPLAAARQATGDVSLDELVEREAGVYARSSIRRVA